MNPSREESGLLFSVLFPLGQVILARVVLARFAGRVVSAQLGPVASAQFQRWVVSAGFKG